MVENALCINVKRCFVDKKNGQILEMKKDALFIQLISLHYSLYET